MGTVRTLNNRKWGEDYQGIFRSKKLNKPLTKVFRTKSEAKAWITHQEAVIMRGDFLNMEARNHTVQGINRKIHSRYLRREKKQADTISNRKLVV
jgi:hypothetical protein